MHENIILFHAFCNFYFFQKVFLISIMHNIAVNISAAKNELHTPIIPKIFGKISANTIIAAIPLDIAISEDSLPLPVAE